MTRKKKRYRRSLIRLRIVISDSRCRLTCSRMNSTRRNKNTLNSLHTHSASARWYAAVADARTTAISSASDNAVDPIDYSEEVTQTGHTYSHIFGKFLYLSSYFYHSVYINYVIYNLGFEYGIWNFRI